MRILFLLLLLAGAACDKDSKAGDKPGAAPPATSRDALIAAWKKGGLQPSALVPAQVAFGKDCQSGTVGAIDVLVCSYASEAEAKAASDAAYGWVGEATGAVKASGPLLIAAADRRKGDPSGRTINQLIKLAGK
jgi:hypothetical protein